MVVSDRIKVSDYLVLFDSNLLLDSEPLLRWEAQPVHNLHISTSRNEAGGGPRVPTFISAQSQLSPAQPSPVSSVPTQCSASFDFLRRSFLLYLAQFSSVHLHSSCVGIFSPAAFRRYQLVPVLRTLSQVPFISTSPSIFPRSRPILVLSAPY